MLVTIITMYRGRDAEIMTNVVEGRLTKKDRQAWRKAHLCDEFYPANEDEEDINNMFFRELETGTDHKPAALWNVDGEQHPLRSIDDAKPKPKKRSKS